MLQEAMEWTQVEVTVKLLEFAHSSVTIESDEEMAHDHTLVLGNCLLFWT